MKLSPKTPLTPAQKNRRAELEVIVKRGIGSCLDTAIALQEISDERYYRDTHSTFKDYMLDVWGMEVRKAYQLIEHADMVKSLPAECATVAQTITPRATRVLKKVAPEDRAQVIEMAAEKTAGKPTEKAIKEAAAELCPEKPKTLDAEAKKAFAGLSLPNREQELAAHFEGYRSALSHLLKDIPKDADFGLYLIEGNKFVALLSNRKQDQQNAKAYV
jgi:hypothetical protein